MAQDDGFELWLGRIGQDRPLRKQLSAARARSGHGKRRHRGFTGVRIGRGGRAGAALKWRDLAFTRRVVVRARIVKLGTKGLGAARAHLRYLERDGTTREGGRGTLYGPAENEVDGKAFLERGSGDRHQFRFIVAPEDGARYDDLKPMVRSLMRRVEQDLCTRLNWVAADHFNTGHPHSHVVVRGKDELGKDLIIARDYITHGLRARATELVEIQLGPRKEAEILRSRLNEIGQERFTEIDRRLLASLDERGHVRPAHSDGIEQSLRAGRLQTLGRIGLADEVERGLWKLDPRLETALRRMGEVGDIIRIMNRALREKLPQRGPADTVIYDPAGSAKAPFVGRVVERGLCDEHADRHYLIVDGVDGLTRYVDIGIDAARIPENGIVRISPTPIAVRRADVTVAEIAAANGGRYTIEAHLKHDRLATEESAERHVRRLEAICRTTGGVDREPDGTWGIASDHLERAQAYERTIARRAPVVVEMLSVQPLERLPAHDGATWLDRELLTQDRTALGRGFGADVARALMARQQWLIEQDLVKREGDELVYPRDTIARLQQRELRRVAMQLSRELGAPFTKARAGDPVEGKLKGSVQVGDTKFAIIENSREFTLVPWRPVLEREIGNQVSGIMRESGIDWTIGRSRGLSI
jgi:type IV secretory pathway VirD2 relaxase